MDTLFGLFAGILCMIFPLAIIFGVAYWAAQSRKKKQDATLSTIPSNAEIKAAVRYNIGNQQGKFLKLKAFQGSGILYVIDEQLYFQDTLNQSNYTFDLKNIQINWVGENLLNGLLKWFVVKEGDIEYYFNIDSGMFIFNTDSSKPTTMSVFQSLLAYQKKLKS